jgi:hypothetical protein
MIQTGNNANFSYIHGQAIDIQSFGRVCLSV